jgi:hypothetical protein
MDWSLVTAMASVSLTLDRPGQWFHVAVSLFASAIFFDAVSHRLTVAASIGEAHRCWLMTRAPPPQMPPMPANMPAEGTAKVYVIEGKRADPEIPAEPGPAQLDHEQVRHRSKSSASDSV